MYYDQFFSGIQLLQGTWKDDITKCQECFIVVQMEKEIRELTKQRDLAQSRVEDLLQIIGNDQSSNKQVCRK